jgi:hypothetical protein
MLKVQDGTHQDETVHNKIFYKNLTKIVGPSVLDLLVNIHNGT